MPYRLKVVETAKMFQNRQNRHGRPETALSTVRAIDRSYGAGMAEWLGLQPIILVSCHRIVRPPARGSGHGSR